MYIKIPSELTDEQTEEYQKIYYEVYGKEIQKEEARVQALAVIRLVAIVINDSGKTIWTMLWLKWHTKMTI